MPLICEHCTDKTTYQTQEEVEDEGEWVLAFQYSENGEARKEKWMLLKTEGGCEWRGMEDGTEAVVVDGEGGEWILFS
jgi:hypothetical protein